MAASSTSFWPKAHPRNPLRDVCKFNRIHESENSFRRQIGAQTNNVAKPYEHLVPIPEYEFQNIRLAMRDQEKLNFRDKNRSGRSKIKDHFIYPPSDDRRYQFKNRFFFATILDQLPEELRTSLVLAGGSVLSAITGDEPSDYDLFVVKGKLTSETVITSLLETWEPHIVYVSRSVNAITFTLRPTVYQPEAELDIRTQYANLCQDTLQNVTEATLADASSSEKLKTIASLMCDHRKTTEVLTSMLGVMKWLPMALNSEDHQRNYKVQIILREYRTPSEVVHGFDLSASALLYHMGAYYGTRAALHTLKSMTQYVSLDRASTTYNHRLVKYLKRGFRIYTPVPVSRHHKTEAQNLILDQKPLLVEDGTLLGSLLLKPGSDTGFEGTLVGLYALSKGYVPRRSSSSNPPSDYDTYYDEGGKPHDVYLHCGKQQNPGAKVFGIAGYGFRAGTSPIGMILNAEPMRDYGIDFSHWIVPTKFSLIRHDPGRQWTGSFNPLDLNLETWGRKRLGTLNYERVQNQRAQALAKYGKARKHQ